MVQKQNLIMRKVRAVQIVDNISLAQVRGSGGYVKPFPNRVLAGQTF